jgi:hypothetical protein
LLTLTEVQRYKAVGDAIKAYTKEHTKSPEAARAALIREGIYDKQGRIKDCFNEALDLREAAA